MFYKSLLTLLFFTFPLIAEEEKGVDLVEVFKASPLIYSILLALSLFAFMIWCYSLLTLKISTLVPPDFAFNLKKILLEKKYEEAQHTCQRADHFFGAILASGISSRKHGHLVVLETMQSEGKRCGIALWQRLSLLNDVAIIAPMLGLLGTVMGLFYAFYDMNRSAETLVSIFDGLGIAVGTTVAGLIVAIFAMIFYATLKFRVVKLLNQLENEALAFGNMIEPL